MNNSQFPITAEVYASLSNDSYYVKVHFPTLGMTMADFKVLPSKLNEGYWVQPPKTLVKGQWKQRVEFTSESFLWPIIERLCLEAVGKHKGQDIVITDIPENFDVIEAMEAFEKVISPNDP